MNKYCYTCGIITTWENQETYLLCNKCRTTTKTWKEYKKETLKLSGRPVRFDPSYNFEERD